jgi:ribose transport system permease protein
MGIGLLFVMLTAGIDLSAGSIAGLCGMIMAYSINFMGFTSLFGLVGAYVVSIGVGCLFGLAMGLLISKGKMAAFIVTLAVNSIGRGLAYMISGGQPIRIDKETEAGQSIINFGKDSLFVEGGLPMHVVLIIVLVIVFFFILKYTAFGRIIISIGSNEDAVRLAGIKVDRYKTAAYMICSSMAALAGILIASRAAIGTSTAGDGLELDAIAGCVIGGTSLEGGKGNIILVIFGVLILGLIGNIMNLMSIPDYPQKVIKGLIIIGAVALQMATSRSERAS